MVTVSALRPSRREDYWAWLALALYLLITVDLLTTFGAVARFGVGVEANPLVASLLTGPFWLLIGVHVAVVFGVTYGFAAVLRLLDRMPPGLRARFETAVRAWLVLLVAAGLLLAANNLAVLLHGVPLP